MRLIDYSEEVVLYVGYEVEKDIFDKGYFIFIKYVNYIFCCWFYYGFMEDFVIKYFWGVFGLLLCSVFVFVKFFG